jgi:tetratricopeptide (TPR) repeat protein
MFPLVMLVLALSAWVGFSDQLLRRWESTELVELSQMDARFQHWRETAPAIQEMGPLGSGLGSYRHVHRLYSQSNERGIFEYAENQFFQSLVESGLPGFLLFMAAWVLAFRYALLLIVRGQSTSTVGVGTMGIFLLSSQAVASLFDFGLYIPANMVLMAMLIGLLGYQAHAFSARLKKSNWLRFRVSNRFIQIGIILAFGSLTASALNLFRHAKIDSAIRNDNRIARGPDRDWNFQQLGLSQTDRRIENMKAMLRHCGSIDGLNHLGNLYVHRFRLMNLDVLKNTETYRNTYALAVDDKERQSLQDEAWNSTRLEQVRNYIQDQGYNYSQQRAIGWTRQPFVTDNVPLAYGSFALSRFHAPIQPVVHMKLGQLNGLQSFSKVDCRGGDEIEAAIQLAPTNAQLRLLGGVFFVQSHNLKAAAPHFKRFLELNPHELKMVIDILYARTDFNSYAVAPRTVMDSILPDDPMILYHFSKSWCTKDPETKTLALKKTESLLDESNLGEQEKLKIRADVQLERGEADLAIETMTAILRGNPLEETIRFQRAHLLFQAKRYQEALKEAEDLVRSNRMNRGYNDLLKHVKSEIQKLNNSPR